MGLLNEGIKRPEREADHYHLVPRLRKRGAINPHLQPLFIERCLVKHRDNLRLLNYNLLIYRSSQVIKVQTASINTEIKNAWR
jgi:hypothetical protein